MKNKENKTEKEIETNLNKLNYPQSEDIYNKGKKESEISVEDTSRNKQNTTIPSKMNEMGIDEIETGDDLDVPGSELDDAQENIGSEDEENNYYSQADTK